MALLFERSITIEDLPQAVREGVFRMRMHVDTAEMGCSEATLREELAALGKELDVEVQGRLPADREPRSIAVAVSRESHRLEAISRHPNDGLTRIRGRTQVRGPDTSDFRLGGPEGLTDWLPDRPIDGLGEFVAERPGADDGTACAHGDGTESEGD